MDYPITQFTALLEAELQIELNDASLQLSIVAVGCQGDHRAIERLQREIERAR